MADLGVDCRALREAIPPSAEHMAADIKALQVGLGKFKADHAQEFGDLARSIQAHNELEKLRELEDRLLLRQDDVVRALTRKLADRDETTRKFRLTNHHVKNVYNLLSEHIHNANSALSQSPTS